MQLKNRKPIIPKNILWRSEENNIVIFDERNGEPYLLNETASVVWKYCVAQKSVTEIVSLILSEYGRDNQSIKSDIVALLKNLRKKGVLTFQHVA